MSLAGCGGSRAIFADKSSLRSSFCSSCSCHRGCPANACAPTSFLCGCLILDDWPSSLLLGQISVGTQSVAGTCCLQEDAVSAAKPLCLIEQVLVLSNIASASLSMAIGAALPSVATANMVSDCRLGMQAYCCSYKRPLVRDRPVNCCCCTCHRLVLYHCCWACCSEAFC